jgi:hypothetical protein
MDQWIVGVNVRGESGVVRRDLFKDRVDRAHHKTIELPLLARDVKPSKQERAQESGCSRQQPTDNRCSQGVVRPHVDNMLRLAAVGLKVGQQLVES